MAVDPRRHWPHDRLRRRTRERRERAPLVGLAAVGLDTIAQVEPKKTAYRYIHFKHACRPSIKGDHALAFALQAFEALITGLDVITYS